MCSLADHLQRIMKQRYVDHGGFIYDKEVTIDPLAFEAVHCRCCHARDL